MYFEVGKDVIARDYTEALLSWCKEHLCLQNPEYEKKKCMGLWCGNTPREIVLYAKNGADLILPFGCVDDLRKVFPECRFLSRICPLRRISYDSGINLYDYQQKAVEAALEGRNGVIVMPCGAGKTQTALEIVSRIGGKTLWLTHTSDLLNQSLNRAKSVLNPGIYSYGTITGGKVNIGEGLTFATVQTMSKLDLAAYRDVWDVVIVDECHKAVGGPTKVMQFYKVLSNLSCRYKFGLTATPKRADGLERAMFSLIGDVLYEVSREEVADTTCSVMLQAIETKYIPDFDVVLAGDGTLNYASLTQDLIENQERFELVSNVIDLESVKGAMLVLANRVDYISRLQKKFNGKSVCLSTMGVSRKAKEERKEALRKLNAGELDCIFATYQLAKEGLDVPNLRTLVLATPEKDETTVMQSVGRVARKFDGKGYGMVVDFVDEEFAMYKKWFRKRMSVYKKLNVLY